MENTTNPHAQAKPPTSGKNVMLSWGLVSIPLKVGVAAEKAAGVERHLFTPEGHEVGSTNYDKVTGVLVDKTTIVKKATTAAGVEVELTDDEVATYALTGAKGMADVVSTIPLDAIGTIYRVTATHYAVPQMTGTGRAKADNPAAIKAFALLRRGLTLRGEAALCQVAFSGMPRWAALMPDGRFLMLAFATEVRDAPVLAEPELSDKEVAMATALLDGLGCDTPVLVDTATPVLVDYIEAKAAGQSPAAPAEAPAPVADLEAALAASLAALGSKVA